MRKSLDHGLFFVVIIVNYFLIRRFWFHSDDWFWFNTLEKTNFEVLSLKYSEIHMVGIPAIIFKSIITLLGLSSFWLFLATLMLVNFSILVLLRRFIVIATGMNSTFVSLLLLIWYTNSWGRENIRWPMAVTTNLSLLMILFLMFLIEKKVKFASIWIVLLTLFSSICSSWAFAYIPFLIGYIWDSDYASKIKKYYSLLACACPLIIAISLNVFSDKTEENAVNLLGVFFIIFLAPIFSLVAFSPLPPLDLLFVLNFSIKIILFAFVLFLARKDRKLWRNFKESRNKYTVIGAISSILAFAFLVSLGRSSSNYLILLSSRFSFALTLLMLISLVFLLGPYIDKLSKAKLIKAILIVLLAFQFLILDRDLQADSLGEKWERIEFTKVREIVDKENLSDAEKSKIRCCNMDPSVDGEALVRIFSFKLSE